MEKKQDNTPDKAAETLPGVDINRADDNKVTPQLLNEETKVTQQQSTKQRNRQVEVHSILLSSKILLPTINTRDRSSVDTEFLSLVSLNNT